MTVLSGAVFLCLFSGQKGGFMSKHGGRDPPEKYHAAAKRMKQKTKTGKGEETGDGFRRGSGICFSAVHEKWCGMTLDSTMAGRGNRKQQLL